MRMYGSGVGSNGRMRCDEEFDTQSCIWSLLGHAQQGMIRESPVLVMCLDSVFLLVWIALAIGEPHVESLSILQSYTSRHTKTRNEASFELSERILCARPAAIRDLLLRQKRPTIAAEETYY
jgi:hypothetical protein